MLTQKLSRNGITYDLTASMIGTNKARAESFSTWKTKGSIYTKKIDANGVYWGATFNVPEMAADAKIEARLNPINGTNYKISLEENSISIPIDFGGIVTNMTKYVSSDDIKIIKAELLIDGKTVSNISKEKESSVNGEYTLNVDKRKYNEKSFIEILVKCNVLAETKFKEDIPMYDSKEEVIIIEIEEKEDKVNVSNVHKNFSSGDKPKILDIEIKRISTDKNKKEIYEYLNIAKKTNTNFICAGQVIYIRVKAYKTDSVTLEIEGDKSITTLDELTKRFEWDEPKTRGIKTRFGTLKNFQKQYKMPFNISLEESNGYISYFSTTYVIPYKTKQTLNSWITLREKNKDAFSIKEGDLFTRIDRPYELVFKARSENGIRTTRTKLDVFEAWNTIYNRDLTNYIK